MQEREIVMDEIDHYTGQNRHAWNEIAQARQRKMYPPEFYANGDYNFEDHELATLGDVRGLEVLHMPCASGEDTLSFAVLGAQPTGVDISDAEIVIARDKAARAGLDVRFVCADIFALPPDLQVGTFDLVYASAGALCWLPDIKRWAAIVAAALKPGGRLILCEHHPFFRALDVSNGRVDIGCDYFGRGMPVRDEGELGHLAGGVEASEHYYTFNWPLGDVVTAVIEAGMRLERLREFPYEDSEYHTHLSEEFRATLRRLPVEFHLVARKE
jgi:SAM-dependent methyltransferase